MVGKAFVHCSFCMEFCARGPFDHFYSLHFLRRRMIPWTIATFLFVFISSISAVQHQDPEANGDGEAFWVGCEEGWFLSWLDWNWWARSGKNMKKPQDYIANPMVDHHLYSKVEIWVVIPIFEHAGISSCGFYAECFPIISHYIPIISSDLPILSALTQ